MKGDPPGVSADGKTQHASKPGERAMDMKGSSRAHYPSARKKCLQVFAAWCISCGCLRGGRLVTSTETAPGAYEPIQECAFAVILLVGLSLTVALRNMKTEGCVYQGTFTFSIFVVSAAFTTVMFDILDRDKAAMTDPNVYMIEGGLIFTMPYVCLLGLDMTWVEASSMGLLLGAPATFFRGSYWIMVMWAINAAFLRLLQRIRTAQLEESKHTGKLDDASRKIFDAGFLAGIAHHQAMLREASSATGGGQGAGNGKRAFPELYDYDHRSLDTLMFDLPDMVPDESGGPRCVRHCREEDTSDAQNFSSQFSMYKLKSSTKQKMRPELRESSASSEGHGFPEEISALQKMWKTVSKQAPNFSSLLSEGSVTSDNPCDSVTSDNPHLEAAASARHLHSVHASPPSKKGSDTPSTAFETEKAQKLSTPRKQILSNLLLNLLNDDQGLPDCRRSRERILSEMLFNLLTSDQGSPNFSAQLTEKPEITQGVTPKGATSSLQSVSLPVTGIMAVPTSKAMAQNVAANEGASQIATQRAAYDLEAAEYEATSGTEPETLPFRSMLQLLSDIDGKQYYFDQHRHQFMPKHPVHISMLQPYP